MSWLKIFEPYLYPSKTNNPTQNNTAGLQETIATVDVWSKSLFPQSMCDPSHHSYSLCVVQVSWFWSRSMNMRAPHHAKGAPRGHRSGHLYPIYGINKYLCYFYKFMALPRIEIWSLNTNLWRFDCGEKVVGPTITVTVVFPPITVVVKPF